MISGVNDGKQPHRQTGRHRRSLWLIAAGSFGLVAVLLVGCSAEGIDQMDAPTALAKARSSAPEILAGKWCDAAKVICVDMSQLWQGHPDAFVNDEYADGGVPGATVYRICLEADLDVGCTTAASLTVELLPVGVAWDCPAAAKSSWGSSTCDPDMSASHDLTQVRLLVLPNHGSDEPFVDRPPLYRTR